MEKISEVLKSEPAFRAKQIKKAVYSDLIEGWDKATILPKDLRQKIATIYPIPEIKAEKVLTSTDDQTEKVLFFLSDGFKIESVLMRHSSKNSEQTRNTVCVSSQVGCAMQCLFCATGRQGFKRNLSVTEIIGQILYFARKLKKENKKISNIVFMGMGEPFLNYDNVLRAIKILNDKDGFNLGSRHISISTVGVNEGIDKLTKENLQVNLAVSLHAPNNELRINNMPINKKYPIEKILNAVDNYIKETKRRVMFEYLMIDGVNDSREQAKELAKLIKKPLYFINLISFNPVGHSDFKPSPGWKIKNFKEILEKSGINVTQRYRFGREIDAACGQLAGKNS
jgi:23S rRNA (adenine2503-C2)-methyltransferase